MTNYEIEQMVRDEFSRLFERDNTIEQIFKRIRRGTATHEDSSVFANQIGDILKKALKSVDVSDADIDYLSYNILGNCLNQNYRLTTLVAESVQNILLDASGLGVNAIVPGINKNRIAGLQTLISNADTTEQVEAVLGEPVVNFTQYCVDYFVKKNAEFNKQIGMDPIVARKYEGQHYDPHREPHMQDCQYCKELAGEWAYGEEPLDVFKRHEGCRCTVAYFPNKKSKGTMMALSKGEKDTDGVLWNTGQYTSNSRKAVLARRRKLYGKEEARKILNEEWKGGFNGNAERHF